MDTSTVVIRLFGPIVSYNEKNGNDDKGTFDTISKRVGHLFEGDAERRERWKPLLLVSSRGGSTETALSLYSIFKQLPQSLTALGIGQVDSAAIFPYLAAEKRIATSTTTFMIHAGKYSMRNVPRSEVVSSAKGSQIKEEVELEIIASACGINKSTARKWYRDGKHFSAADAAKYGLVHEITDKSMFRGMDEIVLADTLW